MYLVSLPVRQKLYGILLRDRAEATSNDDEEAPPPHVREWVVYGPETLDRMLKRHEPSKVRPRMPSTEV